MITKKLGNYQSYRYINWSTQYNINKKDGKIIINLFTIYLSFDFTIEL